MTDKNIKPIFTTGQVVKLNSGGPDMTVKRLIKKSSLTDVGDYNEDKRPFAGSYECQWFAGKKLESGIFPQDSLMAVNKQEV